MSPELFASISVLLTIGTIVAIIGPMWLALRLSDAHPASWAFCAAYMLLVLWVAAYAEATGYGDTSPQCAILKPTQSDEAE